MIGGPAREQNLELLLRDEGVSEKDIGWVLSKLDSQEYILDKCHFLAQILCKESETQAKEIFIHRFFSLRMQGINSESNVNHIFKECIDKKKIWTLLEKNFGATCIKLPDRKVNGEKYLFICGPNKKCLEAINIDSLIFLSHNKRENQNPLEKSSLRLAI